MVYWIRFLVNYYYVQYLTGEHVTFHGAKASHDLDFRNDFLCLILILEVVFNQFDGDNRACFFVHGFNDFAKAARTNHFDEIVLWH